jgi:hypothetical protein
MSNIKEPASSSVKKGIATDKVADPNKSAGNQSVIEASEIKDTIIASRSIGPLLELMDRRTNLGWSPWAVILVQFNDQTQPWPPMSKYQRLFTSAGTGTLNMVDFFRDMSHGRVDISGSKIFGPYTLPYKRSEYGAKLTRIGLIDSAKKAATDAGVSLSDFSGVCVSCLGSVDLFGALGGMAACCDVLSLSPSLLGQEMGHGYGLDHARLEGSSADYMDPWDVMSTAVWPNMQAPHSEFTTVGPGMNASEMRSRGWLVEARVWNPPFNAWEGTIQLRPLHRLDLPGFLAAEIGPYLFEFRARERWDAAIPRPCILAHTFSDNHSYLEPAASGSQDIEVGDKFERGNPTPYTFEDGGYIKVEVSSIDTINLVATLKISLRPARHLPAAGPAQLFGGVASDGGGFIIIGGKIIRIPPRGPEAELVAEVARYLEIDVSKGRVDTQLKTKREALEGIASKAAGLYSKATPISEPPPGYNAKQSS